MALPFPLLQGVPAHGIPAEFVRIVRDALTMSTSRTIA